MKKRTLAALLAVILAFALVLSACGKTDDDDEDEDESRPAKTEERADKEGQKAKPRHYREQRWYDADGALLEVDSFDVDGHLIRYDVYTEDGDLDYIIEMRSTDDCETIDDTTVASMDGVVEVEVCEAFLAEGSAPNDFEKADRFFIFGYNKQGEIAGMQLVMISGGQPVVFHTTEYTCDLDGNELTARRVTGSGDVYYERSDENTIVNGEIQKKVSTFVFYGKIVNLEGVFSVAPHDEPVTEVQTCEYIY